MNSLKRFFIKAHLTMIVILAMLMALFSLGQDTGIMIFILGTAICYAVCWMVLYVTVIGTIQDIWQILKRDHNV